MGKADKVFAVIATITAMLFMAVMARVVEVIL